MHNVARNLPKIRPPCFVNISLNKKFKVLSSNKNSICSLVNSPIQSCKEYIKNATEQPFSLIDNSDFSSVDVYLSYPKKISVYLNGISSPKKGCGIFFK